MKKNSRFAGFYMGLIFFLMYLPIAVVIVFSFNESKLPVKFTGFSLKWYQELFHDRAMLEALVNSLILGVLSCLVSAVIGTLGAVGLSRIHWKSKGALEYISILPLMIPEIILGMVLMAVFYMLNLPFGMLTLLIGHTVFCVPYILMEVKARLAGMDPALEEAARDLAVRVQDLDVKIVSQMGGLIELARMEESDILVTAIVGMIGIRPTMEAILAGKDIALANKETLVTAGHLIMPLSKQFGVQILPVDSEHSAIFQALHGEKREQIHKLLITASGGPFRGKKTADLEKVTLEDTLKHPNWVMGQKITVDSATLVNKGLEVMEARWLFDVDLDHIQVVVQPQSIIHSMVEFEDGAVMAQLGTPDMRLPIQYALCYPDRRFLKGDRLDFHMLKQITFEEPDRKTFKGLPMAVEAARAGGSMPTVFNAANELAVRKFLQKKISFLDIYEIIGQSMSRHTAVKDPDLDQILEIEKETYRWIESRW